MQAVKRNVSRHSLAAWCAVGTALLAGCIMPGTSQEPERAQETRPRPPILCEMGHSNFATIGVITFTGIASNGQVLAFDSRTSGLGGFTLLDLALTERPRAADLLHRYVISAPTGTRVPAETLDRIATLTMSVRSGTVSREPGGADIGQTTLECFVAMPEGIRFQRVVVAGAGDWTLRNTHPQAEELLNLLTEILGPIEPVP